MIKRLFFAAALALPLVAGLGGCKKPTATAETKTYTGHGVVQGFQADGRVVILKHDRIAGLMEGMTMGFELKDAAMSRGLAKGDTVDFTLEVAEDSPLIVKIVKVAK